MLPMNFGFAHLWKLNYVMVLVKRLVVPKDNLGAELEPSFMLGESWCEFYTYLRASLLHSPFAGYLISQKNFPNLQNLVYDQFHRLNPFLTC
jgi:hypothetical protein